MVCTVLRHLERIPFDRKTTKAEKNEYTECFCAALAYLSKILFLAQLPKPPASLLHSQQTQDETIANRSMTELYNLFEDYRLVESIILQQIPLERCWHVTTEESASILKFLIFLATSGETNLVTFLEYIDIPPLLNGMLRSALPHHQGSLRRYRPLHNAGLLLEPDPTHENCIKVFQFLTSWLKASTDAVSTSSNGHRLKPCFDKALYCLDSNRLVVRQCLQQVIDAVLDDSNHHQHHHRTMDRLSSGHARGLTIQALREASAILSLVTEVCSNPRSLEMFRQKYGSLYAHLASDARRVVLSLCSFLGASGISRELFQAMADLEKSNGGSLSVATTTSTTTRLGFSPVIDVFMSSGRSNTRHEAIQFSHFVSGCSAAVSADEIKNKSKFLSMWKPTGSGNEEGSGLLQSTGELTESSLEQNSRHALTNRFAFELEKEAGKCLFHACNALWVTHPSRSSFVEFTGDEIATLKEDISWIKVHDIIAFRQDDTRDGLRLLGEVQYVDTINLQFHVRPLYDKENTRNTIIVSLSRLSGVEDRNKRMGTLAFQPAPETSSELHSSQSDLSIGHLILAMRWCHEYAFEELQQQGVEDTSTWCQKNAQILSLILVKELSLHRESSSDRPATSPEVMRMLRAQLLDLFGDRDEYATFLAGYQNATMRENGRLCDLLVGPNWTVVRKHLEEELQEAIRDILSVQMEETQKVQRVQYHFPPANGLL